MNTHKNHSRSHFNYSAGFRKIIMLLLCMFFLVKLDAQNITENQPDEFPQLYLGFGTGFDSFTGFIGLSGTLKVYDRVSVRGGYGASGWGQKGSIGIKYDTNETGKWSYCLGYSHSPGLKGLELNMELESGVEKEIKVDYLSASTINLAIDRNWRIGRAGIFYIEFGYAIPLQSNRWRVTDGSDISSISESTLNLLQPGGLILGAGFAFKVF